MKAFMESENLIYKENRLVPEKHHRHQSLSSTFWVILSFSSSVQKGTKGSSIFPQNYLVVRVTKSAEQMEI